MTLGALFIKFEKIQRHHQNTSGGEFVGDTHVGLICIPVIGSGENNHSKFIWISFQLRQGFRVIRVARDYIKNDPESHGHAAIIEWLNDAVADPSDYERGESRYRVPDQT